MIVSMQVRKSSIGDCKVCKVVKRTAYLALLEIPNLIIPNDNYNVYIPGIFLNILRTVGHFLNSASCSSFINFSRFSALSSRFFLLISCSFFPHDIIDS